MESIFVAAFVDELEKVSGLFGKSRKEQIEEALEWSAKQRDKGVEGFEQVGGKWKKGDKPFPKGRGLLGKLRGEK